MKKRLEKIISSQNNLSRKEIKKEIKIGNVLVDGQIQKDPAFKINPLINKIVFKNEEIEYQEFIYIVLNKPKNYVCATKDKDQSTIMDLINRYNNFDLHIVGRLDKDTTGIVLLTNDGQWTHELKSPKKNVEKEYEVVLKNNLTEEMIINIQAEMKLDNKILKPIKITNNVMNKCNITLTEGKYHQIKRMFYNVGNEVVELNRIRVGNLKLNDLNLLIGEWKDIDKNLI